MRSSSSSESIPRVRVVSGRSLVAAAVSALPRGSALEAAVLDVGAALGSDKPAAVEQQKNDPTQPAKTKKFREKHGKHLVRKSKT